MPLKSMRTIAITFMLAVSACESSVGGDTGTEPDAPPDAPMDNIAIDLPSFDAPEDAPSADLDGSAMPDVPPPPPDMDEHTPPPLMCDPCITCPCAPPADPTNCSFPQGIPDESFGYGPGLPVLHAQVNSVMTALTGCSVGSDCDHGSGPGDTGAQAWMARVTAALRAQSLCAGQHRDGETDEIAVARNCRGHWEGYHVANYGAAKVVWAGVPSAPCGGSDCPALGGGSFRGLTWVPDHCP